MRSAEACVAKSAYLWPVEPATLPEEVHPWKKIMIVVKAVVVKTVDLNTRQERFLRTSQIEVTRQS